MFRTYEERKAARISRLRARAAARVAEAAAADASLERIAACIPRGQPILVGHHSEKRHRRDIKRIDQAMRRSVEATREAAQLERRADAAEANTAISSDDPSAVALLKEKLATIEAERARYVAINKACRARDPQAALTALNLSERTIASLIEPDEYTGRKWIPGWKLTNLGAEARRLTKRIAALEDRAARPAPEPEIFGGVRVEESDNRVQLFFPGKPSEQTRTELKSHGFRWAPSVGAWQRQATADGWYWARKIAGALVQSASETGAGETRVSEKTAEVQSC